MKQMKKIPPLQKCKGLIVSLAIQMITKQIIKVKTWVRILVWNRFGNFMIFGFDIFVCFSLCKSTKVICINKLNLNYFSLFRRKKVDFCATKLHLQILLILWYLIIRQLREKETQKKHKTDWWSTRYSDGKHKETLNFSCVSL